MLAVFLLRFNKEDKLELIRISLIKFLPCKFENCDNADLVYVKDN